MASDHFIIMPAFSLAARISQFGRPTTRFFEIRSQIGPLADAAGAAQSILYDEV
jgi:hypothetical protein